MPNRGHSKGSRSRVGVEVFCATVDSLVSLLSTLFTELTSERTTIEQRSAKAAEGRGADRLDGDTRRRGGPCSVARGAWAWAPLANSKYFDCGSEFGVGRVLRTLLQQDEISFSSHFVSAISSGTRSERERHKAPPPTPSGATHRANAGRAAPRLGEGEMSGVGHGGRSALVVGPVTSACATSLHSRGRAGERE